MLEVKQVMIVGAGTMGVGIAQTMAARGLRVLLVDREQPLLDRAEQMLRANVETMVRERLCTPEEEKSIWENISYAPEADLPDVAGRADLVVESVFEDPDIKRAVYEKLSRYCREDCILCSNTSASNVFEIARVSHPERFLITHWFNPAYLMELVEIVRGPETSDEVAGFVEALLKDLGKKTCVLNQYVPGFIVNRLANALCREAGYMIMNGWTDAESIEAAIRATSGIRYAFEGPLALNDVVGWDLIEQGCRDVFPSLCNDTESSALAQKLVAEGRLGVKSGKGLFDYSQTTPADFMAERAKKIVKMYHVVHDV